MSTVREELLADLASVIRSKNAGPWELTLDILFRTPEDYRRVRDAGAIDVASVCRLYRVAPQDVLGIHHFDAASAVKITLRRPRVSGAAGETDVYGAQQHAPLLGWVLRLPAG